jgi:predicted nucleic-acid-binding protein
MIGLDTNVLVRYLTRDEPAQYARAAAVIETGLRNDDRFFVNSVVLCELVWVLDSVYEYSRNDIGRALEQILSTAQFEIEKPDETRQALSDFRTTKADFSDALVGRINRTMGAEHTATFDRALKPLDTFRVL